MLLAIVSHVYSIEAKINHKYLNKFSREVQSKLRSKVLAANTRRRKLNAQRMGWLLWADIGDLVGLGPPPSLQLNLWSKFLNPLANRRQNPMLQRKKENEKLCLFR